MGNWWAIARLPVLTTQNRAEGLEAILEADLLATAVLSLMANKEVWTGTASELLEALEGCVSERATKSKTWPKSLNALSNRLRRTATLHRAKGLEVDRERDKNRRSIVIRKVRQKIVTIVTTVTTQKSPPP